MPEESGSEDDGCEWRGCPEPTASSFDRYCPHHEEIAENAVTDGGEESGSGLAHVDLCCGLGGWSEPFRESDRWRSVGLDIRPDLEADIVADVRHLPLDCSPTLVTASPPCTEFSRYNMPWLDGDPEAGMELVRACLQAVERLDPDYWILENVLGLHRYWKPARKIIRPQYLWGEFPPFDAAVTDGGKMQTSGKNPEERSKIPYAIADSLRRSVEVHHA